MTPSLALGSRCWWQVGASATGGSPPNADRADRPALKIAKPPKNAHISVLRAFPGKLRAHPRSFDLPCKAEAAFEQTSPRRLIPRKSGPAALGTAAEGGFRPCWLLLRARLALEGL